MPCALVREITLQGSQRKLCQTALDRGGSFDSEALGVAESLQKEELWGRCYLCEGFGKDPESWLVMLNSWWWEQLASWFAQVKAFVVQYVLCAVYANKWVFPPIGKMRRRKKKEQIPSYPLYCQFLVTFLPSPQEQDCVTRDTSNVLDTYRMCVLLPCVGVLSLEPRPVQSAQRVWLWASCHLAPSLTSLAETHLQSWNPDSRALAEQ